MGLPLIAEWLVQTKKLEMPPYGLIPFTIDTRTGLPTQTFRGSNNTWNSFYLPLIDPEYAKEQYSRLKKGMLRRLPGFAGVKEYDKGNLFMVERDAGPVIFGISGSATAFMIAGANHSGDMALSKDLLRSIELLGCSATQGELRHYAVAPIVGDAIVLAMRTAISWRPLWKEGN